VRIRRQLLSIVAITLALVASPMAMAEVKLAVVDVQRAILGSEEAKRLLSQIQDEFKGEEDEVRQIQAEITKMLERAQKDGEVMSEAEKRKLQQQIDDKNNDFVYLRQKLQKQVEARQSELFAGIDQKVQKAIEEIVLSEDYDLILPRQAVIYVGDLYDITRKVTEKLNELEAQ